MKKFKIVTSSVICAFTLVSCQRDVDLSTPPEARFKSKIESIFGVGSPVDTEELHRHILKGSFEPDEVFFWLKQRTLSSNQKKELLQGGANVGSDVLSCYYYLSKNSYPQLLEYYMEEVHDGKYPNISDPSKDIILSMMLSGWKDSSSKKLDKELLKLKMKYDLNLLPKSVQYALEAKHLLE